MTLINSKISDMDLQDLPHEKLALILNIMWLKSFNISLYNSPNHSSLLHQYRFRMDIYMLFDSKLRINLLQLYFPAAEQLKNPAAQSTMMITDG